MVGLVGLVGERSAEGGGSRLGCCLFLRGDYHCLQDNLVGAVDAGEDESFGQGVAGEFHVVRAEEIAEAVDVHFGGAGDEGLAGDEATAGEVDGCGLDGLRHQRGDRELGCGAVGCVSEGAEFGEVAGVGDGQGGNLYVFHGLN